MRYAARPVKLVICGLIRPLNFAWLGRSTIEVGRVSGYVSKMRWVSGLALWMFFGISACRPSRESVSAGQVGCDPNEIEISDEDSSSGWNQSSRSWVATCHGRNFICSELDSAGKDVLVGVVSCHEQQAEEPLVRPRAAALGAERSNSASNAPAAKSTAPPSGGAGFTFGGDMGAEQQACEAAGNTWQRANDSHGSCSGAAADLGFAADVKVTFCHERACIITVRHEPDSNFINLMAELKGKLTAKYGAPSESDALVPEGCRSEKEFESCLAEHSLHLKFAWAWPTGERITLEVGKPDGDSEAAIHIDYTKPVRKVAANADAL